MVAISLMAQEAIDQPSEHHGTLYVAAQELLSEGQRVSEQVRTFYRSQQVLRAIHLLEEVMSELVERQFAGLDGLLRTAAARTEANRRGVRLEALQEMTIHELRAVHDAQQ